LDRRRERPPELASWLSARFRRFAGPNRWSEGPYPCPFRPRSNSSRGFALVAVIWSLGLIALLGIAVIVGARYRAKVTSSLASATIAAAAAESAINLGITVILNTKPGQSINFPLRCQMPGGEQVTVTLEQEAGKVDLNTASPALLARLFSALTSDQSAGARIAGNIVEYRDPGRKVADARSAGDTPDDTKKTGFTTIMELDRIDGISPRLFRKALRFVTVHSGRPEPDGEAASPVLRQFLNLDQKPPGVTHGPPATGEVTIRADVSARDGARFVREALVSLGAENGRPFLIREWRHGDLAPGTEAQYGAQVPQRSCLRFGGAIGS